jgi:hypothetical protein
LVLGRSQPTNAMLGAITAGRLRPWRGELGLGEMTQDRPSSESGDGPAQHRGAERSYGRRGCRQCRAVQEPTGAGLRTGRTVSPVRPVRRGYRCTARQVIRVGGSLLRPVGREGAGERRHRACTGHHEQHRCPQSGEDGGRGTKQSAGSEAGAVELACHFILRTIYHRHRVPTSALVLSPMRSPQQGPLCRACERSGAPPADYPLGVGVRTLHSRKTLRPAGCSRVRGFMGESACEMRICL